MNTLSKTFLVALALSVSAGTAVAFAGDRDHGPRAERMFERMDANGDGMVTLAEFSQGSLDRFAEADADDDGFVTLAEAEQAAEGRRAERFAARMIERFDIDGDERVTADELQNRTEKRFALLDRDDSGDVTLEELPRRMARGGGDRN